jgi:hypothetical protein
MPDLSVLSDLSTTEIAFIVAGFAAFAGYVLFILTPAWGSYGRVWERFAASFLTLYVLAALIGVGAVIGLAVVAIYANFV